MFNKNGIPRIFGHKSVLKNGNFVTPDYILTDDNNLLNRFCPHRMFPLADIGTSIKENIVCNYHGFEWTTNGIPINNDKKILCGKYNIGDSGLIFKNFKEPDHWWVKQLSSENNLIYSHSCQGKSKGSWLWMMDIQADLLHVRKGKNVIHPNLSLNIDLNDIEMFDGDGWILQTIPTGWWLFIYPFTFVEYSPGCLSINYTTPTNINDEYGFTWITQFYYSDKISDTKKKKFETLEDVYKEDVSAIEKIQTKYFPLAKSSNKLEDHCVHFGKWFMANKADH